jgi:hypothetical protein
MFWQSTNDTTIYQLKYVVIYTGLYQQEELLCCRKRVEEQRTRNLQVEMFQKSRHVEKWLELAKDE